MTDRNGVGLAIGDRVLIECVVTDIQPQEDFVNLQLRAREDMAVSIPVNYFNVFSRQVTKLKAQP
jgi:hypothetical protein